LTRGDNLVTIPIPTAISGTSRSQNNNPYRSTRLTPPVNLIDTGHPLVWLRRALRTAVAPLAEPLLDPRPASRLIRSTARKQWLRLVVNLLLSFIQAGAEGATLGVVFLAVDLLSKAQSSTPLKFNWSGLHLLSFAPGLAGSLASLPLGTLFIILLSTAVLLKLVQSLAMYLASVNMGYYSARVNAEVTGLIHHQILRLTLACASRYPVGDLTYYAGAGPGAVMSQIGIASSFIVNVMMVLVYLFVLISLSPWLLAAAALMALVLLFLQRELLPRIRRRSFEAQAISLAISTKITESILGLRLLHTRGQLLMLLITVCLTRWVSWKGTLDPPQSLVPVLGRLLHSCRCS